MGIASAPWSKQLSNFEYKLVAACPHQARHNQLARATANFEGGNRIVNLWFESPSRHSARKQTQLALFATQSQEISAAIRNQNAQRFTGHFTASVTVTREPHPGCVAACPPTARRRRYQCDFQIALQSQPNRSPTFFVASPCRWQSRLQTRHGGPL